MAIVKKYVQKQDLAKYQTWIKDTGPFSDYFKLAQFPDTLRAGKNGFLINGSANLVRTTDIKIEIIDSDGNTVFLQPIRNYSEGLARVISIEVYDDTPTGPALVTIMGEVAFDADGNRAPDKWQGTYNVKWQKYINIEPHRTNDTPVRVYTKPELTVSEYRVPVLTFQSGSTNTITTGSVSGPYWTFPASGSWWGAPPAPDSLTTLITATQPIFVANSLYGTLTATVGGTIYSGTITSITSTTKAYVSFGIVSSSAGTWYASNYSLVYQDPSTYVTGSYARSYANMELTNLTTFTGDIQRAKVYYRGTDTNEVYSLLDDIILEATELTAVLSEVGTYTSYGDIITQGVADAYWESGILNNHTGSIDDLTDYISASPSVNVTASFNDSILHNSVVVTGPSTVNNNVWVGISQDLSVEAGIDYALETTLTCVKSTSTPTQLQIRLYNSSSLNTAGGDRLGYLIDTFDLGTPISKEFGAQQIAFTSPITDTQARLRFVTVGIANWHIADTRLTVASETGFNPSEVTRIIELEGRQNENLQFKVELLDGAYSIVPIDLETDPIFFTGSAVTSAAGGGTSLSSSYATTSSFSTNAVSASYFSGSALFPNGLVVTGSITASIGYQGFLYGTASYALNALTGGTGSLSASYAVTASYAMNGGGGPSVSSSYAETASYANYAVTASYISGAFDISNGLIISGTTFITGSLTVLGGQITGDLIGSSSYATSASYAFSSSYARSSSFASFATSASYALSSSFARSASFASFATTASYTRTAATASYLSGTLNFPNGLIVTGSVTASEYTGSLIGTASWAVTSSYAMNASVGGSDWNTLANKPVGILSGSAQINLLTDVSASWASRSISSSYALSSSYARSSSYASVAATVLTASYATTAATASYLSGTLNFPNGLIVTGSVTASEYTGSLIGTASWSVTSSYAMNAGGGLGGVGILSSSAQINLLTDVSASWASRSISSSYALSSSYARSASYASTVVSASYATTAATASYLSGTLNFPNGLLVTGSVTASVLSGSFTGTLFGSASYAQTASAAGNFFVGGRVDTRTSTAGVTVMGNVAYSTSFDCSNAQAFTATNTGSLIINLVNAPSGVFAAVIFLSSGSNVSPARSTTFGSNIKFTSGSAPALSTNDDLLGFITYNAGATWIGSHPAGKVPR